MLPEATPRSIMVVGAVPAFSGGNGLSELRLIATDQAPAAIGPYSQAIRLGELVFASGQIPLPPGGGDLVGTTIGEQTDRVLANLAAVLAAAGSSLRQVVKTTVFLIDLGDFNEMNEVYARHFGEHRPARSTVQVAALPRGARVEIEAIGAVTG